jgi:hypothetical protein
MSHSTDSLSSTPLHVLLFSFAGACFGVDTSQIEELSAHGGEEAADLFWFHEVIGIDGGDIFYHTPNVLAIRTEDARKYHVIVDAIEDLVEIGMEEIRPFPRIMASHVMQKGMWGVVLRDDKQILLVDFLYLWRQGSTIRDQG